MSILFEPIQVGRVELRNRIVFAPMNTYYEDRGEITDRSIAFYQRIARGRAGLVVFGDCSVQPSVTPTPGIYANRFIPGLKRLVDAVHVQGARIAAQLTHHEYDIAEMISIAQKEGRDAATKLLREDAKNFANRVSIDQIRRIQDLFVASALRAQEAGFDLIQLQGDRLMGLFSSPMLNTRQDRYGGSLENRMRFAIEVISKIRAAAPELPIDYRLALIRANPATGGLTLVGKGGPTLDEARKAAPWMVNVGVNSFLVCQANHGDVRNVIPPAGAAPYGCFIDLAAAVKQVVDVPVAAGGRIIRPGMAETVLSQGKADLIALGRPLLCDPEWGIKAEEGRETEIRECIMCNYCTTSLQNQKPVVCAANAQTGPGVDLEVMPAEQTRKVVVVGGGPAGMEAARVAAMRGHSVILIEQSNTLGGQVRLATVAPYKEEMKRLSAFLMRELPRLWVEVRLGTEATIDMIHDLAPDRIILATGAGPSKKVRGLEVEDEPALVDAWQILAGESQVGRRVIIIGGGRVGLETALFLAAQEKIVTLIEMQANVGMGILSSNLSILVDALNRYGVQILTNHKVISVLSDGVVVEASGEQRMISAESIVNAVNTRRPQRELVEKLRSAGTDCLVIGDCAGDQARGLTDAIHEGFRAGLRV